MRYSTIDSVWPGQSALGTEKPLGFDYEIANQQLLVDLASAIRRSKGRAPRSMRQWCEEELIIPDGPHMNERFAIETQPIVGLWLDALDSGRYVEHVYTGPSQSGKSLFGYVVPTLYHLFELCEKVVFGTPLDEMANDKWHADIRPVMKASNTLRAHLPRYGEGSADGTVRNLIRFANGQMLKIAGAGGADQGKAGFTSRVVCITEAAGFSESTEASDESDPLRQLKARMNSYDFLDQRLYIEGTKQTVDKLPYTLKQFSTKSRIVSPCPHCGEWICPTRENLMGWQNARNEYEVEDKSIWVCPQCGEGIDDSLRRESLMDAILLHDGQKVDKRGKVIGDHPPTRRLWFDYGAWHNAFRSAAAIGLVCWQAEQFEQGTPNRISADKELTQVHFGDIYTPPTLSDTAIIEPDSIESRRLELPKGMLPDDTLMWTVGTDIGKEYAHYVVLAVRPNSLHVVDYGKFDILHHTAKCSLDQAITVALDDFTTQFEAGLATKTGQVLAIKSGAIDRGWVPTPIIKFAATTSGKWLPLLGRGETQFGKIVYSAPKRKTKTIRKIDLNGRFYLELLHSPAKTRQAVVDADAFKRLILTYLRPRSSETEDYPLTLFSGPKSVHRTFCKHLCSEQELIIEMVGQPSVRKWIQKGANHFLDALAYAIAAANWSGWDFTAEGGRGDE